MSTSVDVTLRNLIYKGTTVQRVKNQKEARVHFVPDLKDGIFVNICTPDIIKK